MIRSHKTRQIGILNRMFEKIIGFMTLNIHPANVIWRSNIWLIFTVDVLVHVRTTRVRPQLLESMNAATNLELRPNRRKILNSRFRFVVVNLFRVEKRWFYCLQSFTNDIPLQPPPPRVVRYTNFYTLHTFNNVTQTQTCFLQSFSVFFFFWQTDGTIAPDRR